MRLQRRNPGPAGLPNAPIDLTPLLDIIFIFLFAVIISNASATITAQEEAGKEVEQAENEVKALTGRVELLQEEVFALTAENQAKESLREAYEGEVIGKRVKLVTIYCTYDSGDSTKRRLSAEAPGLTFEPFEFQSTNVESAFSRLKNALTEYIKEVRSAENTAKSERTVIMLYINKESILRRDKERIDRIIEELDRTFEDVY